MKTSPAVASKRAHAAVKARFKASREGKQVESPAAHADRLVAILQPAANSDPAPPSLAYRQWVEATFSDRFLELCGKYPARRR